MRIAVLLLVAAIFHCSTAFAVSVPFNPYAYLNTLQKSFETFQPLSGAAVPKDDLVDQIRAIESRVSWLAVDAEYVARDSQWAYQAAMAYLTGQDAYGLWRAERLAQDASVNAKVISKKILDETIAVRALKVEKPDEFVRREAEYLLDAATKLKAEATAARRAAGDLYSLALRYPNLFRERFMVISETLNNESVRLLNAAHGLSASAGELLQRLKSRSAKN